MPSARLGPPRLCISVDLANRNYIPGDVVQGNLRMSLDRPLYLRHASLSLVVEETSRVAGWLRDRRSSAIRLRLSQDLLSFAGGQGERHDEYYHFSNPSYEWTFFFVLPLDMPFLFRLDTDNRCSCYLGFRAECLDSPAPIVGRVDLMVSSPLPRTIPCPIRASVSLPAAELRMWLSRNRVPTTEKVRVHFRVVAGPRGVRSLCLSLHKKAVIRSTNCSRVERREWTLYKRELNGSAISPGGLLEGSVEISLEECMAGGYSVPSAEPVSDRARSGGLASRLVTIDFILRLMARIPGRRCSKLKIPLVVVPSSPGERLPDSALLEPTYTKGAVLVVKEQQRQWCDGTYAVLGQPSQREQGPPEA